MAEEAQLCHKQKKEIAKWFPLNAPAGEIQYVAKDLKAVLNDDKVCNEAASESFPIYNKSHMICLQMPARSGDVLVTSFGELDENAYLDPRTAQICTEVRPATDEELPSPYIEEFSNGSWCSIWTIEFQDETQELELKGKLQVGAHYFEEGNVQLDAKHECRDTTLFQCPDDCAVSIAHIIQHHETEYLSSIEASYSNLPDNTFKDLRRKLPVTRTLFPWHNTSLFSLTREISKELGIGK